jgi:hypothetical protein
MLGVFSFLLLMVSAKISVNRLLYDLVHRSLIWLKPIESRLPIAFSRRSFDNFVANLHFFVNS